MAPRLALFGGQKAFTKDRELAEATRWPAFTEEEKQAACAALESRDVYAPIADFERGFASYTGSKYALAMNNGTATIHSAYFAAGVGPGDEVITSPYTWHLQVGQILALHAIPVFCDIDPESACIRPDEIEGKITPRTKAISVVHPFGAIAPMDEINEIAQQHDLTVIEDCSHAHGSTYKGRKVGTLGDIGCFSLQASKLMTGIEAGIMVTDDESYYERSCLLGHYERIPQLKSEVARRLYQPDREMAPVCFGFKYRINPLAAALALVQLGHLDEWTRTRRANMSYVTKGLRETGKRHDGVLKPPYEDGHSERVWLNYIALFEADAAGVERRRFIDALNSEGLPASRGRTGYLPVYWNPVYEELLDIWGKGYPFRAPYLGSPVSYPRGLCPVAEAYHTRTVGLPVLHHPTDEAVLAEYVDAVDKVLSNLDALR